MTLIGMHLPMQLMHPNWGHVAIYNVHVHVHIHVRGSKRVKRGIGSVSDKEGREEKGGRYSVHEKSNYMHI